MRTRKKKFFIKGFKSIFSSQLIVTTACLSFSWFLLDISYYGIGLFTPAVLQALHISTQMDLMHSATQLLKNTLVVNLFVMLGAFAVIFYIEKINTFTLQKMGFVFSFFGLLILSLSHTSNQSAHFFMIFSGFILFNFFVNFGPGMTTYLLPAKLYATDMKATGHGFAAGLGKFGAFIGTLFLPILQASMGIYMTVGILSISLFLGIILTHILSKQTFHDTLTSDVMTTDDISFSTT